VTFFNFSELGLLRNVLEKELQAQPEIYILLAAIVLSITAEIYLWYRRGRKRRQAFAMLEAETLADRLARESAKVSFDARKHLLRTHALVRSFLWNHGYRLFEIEQMAAFLRRRGIPADIFCQPRKGDRAAEKSVEDVWTSFELYVLRDRVDEATRLLSKWTSQQTSNQYSPT
jgi:hypothetical protein